MLNQEKLVLMNRKEKTAALTAIGAAMEQRFSQERKDNLLALRESIQKENDTQVIGYRREELLVEIFDACRESDILPWINGVRRAPSMGTLDRMKIDLVIKTEWVSREFLFLQCKSSGQGRDSFYQAQNEYTRKNPGHSPIPCVVVKEANMSDQEILLFSLLEVVKFNYEYCEKIFGRWLYPENPHLLIK